MCPSFDSMLPINREKNQPLHRIMKIRNVNPKFHHLPKAWAFLFPDFPIAGLEGRIPLTE